jgi:2-polyprenyl-3-methyl-5-hydroxy-6-metoxy-1,4-benzoquinol methylase
MTPPNPKDIVRNGYDAVSYRYRGDDDDPEPYRTWATALAARLTAGATVLDLGCGCGVPMTRTLAAQGFCVTGVDLSRVQIERARSLVPDATFVWADAIDVDFRPESFAAVVCLYALIHVPETEQPTILANVRRWLRPGGWLLATTGSQAWTGTEEAWLGGDAPMWWSHADAATYRRWLAGAGLRIESEGFVPEGDSGHQLFWARAG